MDLQTRKLKAIGYLIDLKDEKILNKIEATISAVKTTTTEKLKPYTRKQLVDRAKKANQDYVDGKVKTQEQVVVESKMW
jgi:flagellar basal body rod protein FlgC